MKIKLAELRELIRETILKEETSLKDVSATALLDFVEMWQKELTSNQKNLFRQLINGSIDHKVLSSADRRSLEIMWDAMLGQVEEIDDLFSMWLAGDDDMR